MFVCGRREVIFVFLLQDQNNLLRGTWENIRDQSKVSDIENTTVNLSSNEVFLRYTDVIDSPYAITAHFISKIFESK